MNEKRLADRTRDFLSRSAFISVIRRVRVAPHPSIVALEITGSGAVNRYDRLADIVAAGWLEGRRRLRLRAVIFWVREIDGGGRIATERFQWKVHLGMSSC
jgi:hypothetical protein